MGRKLGFLGFLVCLFVFAFSANAFASCDPIYTSCKTGYYLDSSNCETCPNPASTQSCTGTCSVAHGTCVCDTDSGTQSCTSYNAAQAGSGGVEQCGSCAAWGACSGCTKDITCDTSNGFELSGDSCVCPSGTHEENDACVADPIVCGNGYYRWNGACEECPAGCTCADDTEPSNCPVSCDEDEYVANNTCYSCASGTGGDFPYSIGGTYDITYCYRYCVPGDVDHATAVSNDYVVYYPGTTNYCEATACASGYTLSNGECIENAPTPCTTADVANAYSVGGTVESGCYAVSCNSGYYLDNGSCYSCGSAFPYSDAPNSHGYDYCYRECTTNDVYGSVSLDPYYGYYSDGYNACRATECDEDYYLYNGSCEICPCTGGCDGTDTYNCPDTCAAGQYLLNGVCTTCPAGYYCDGTDKFSCPASHPNSDMGNSSKNKCYANCPVVPPATSVSGRDYYGPNEPDTCTITACEAGYYLVNGSCTECPADYYCDGTNKFSCNTATNGLFPHSAPGAETIGECYTDCPLAQNALSMSGHDYYNDALDDCAIAQCQPDYYPNATGTACIQGTHDCTAGQTTTGGACPSGYYCPARTGVSMDESCEIQCPADTTGGGTISSPNGSTLITQCQTTRTGVDLNDLDNGNASSGGGNMICNYSENVGNVGYTDCGTIAIKYCYAGYYRAATDATVCSKVGTGAWSPNPTNKIEDNASMSRYSCNDLQSGITATTAGANAETSGLPTACYATCPVENVYDSLNNIIGSRTANPDTVYFNGTVTAYNPGPDQNGYGTVTVSGGFPACEYQAPVCNAGYHTVANTCESNIYTFTLNKNGGTGGDNGPIYMKYNVGWFTDSDATTSITSVVLPTKIDGNCSGYAMNSTPVINANGEIVALSTLVNTADYTTPIQLNAGWAPKQTTTCDAGEYYSGQTDSCEPCEPGYWCPGGTTYSGPDSDGDDHFKNACPVATSETYTPAQSWNGTTLVNVAPNVTSAAGSAEESDCYATVRYTATKGAGSQVCHYAAGRYESNCDVNSVQILTCDSGHYRANTNDTDCVAAGLQYYSGQYEITRTRCPNAIYDVDDSRNTILTDGPTSEFVTSCVQNGVWQDTPHGGRTTRCHYNETASDYSTNCDSYTMRICDAGYWDELNGAQTTDVNIDCVVVGEGNYSPAQSSCNGEPAKPTDILGCSTKRYACPAIDSYAGNATTDIASTTPATGTTTAGSAAACYIACITDKTTIGATLTVNNSPVHYNTTNGTYDMCTYDVHECLANYVCDDNGVDSCSNLTNGQYPYSDAGTGDVSYCYTNCTLPEHATAVSGRDYNGAPDTCQITCAAGYALENGQCVICPAGSYCDGTPGDDGDGAELCSTVGDGSWMYSAPGSTSASDCYRSCVEYTQDACLLVPVEAVAYWPNTCQYTATINGHPAELVNGDCALTGCLRGYKLVNGECEMCHVENAISYNLGGCTVETCVIGYHPNGEQCDPDIIDCTPQAPNSTYAEQRWVASRGAYGICTIKNCEDGYHLASNACVDNEQVCDIEHGTGMKVWNTTTNSWGPCIATSCAPGYTNIPIEKNNASQQCSECRNKFSTFGEIAAQAYVTGCEIASCFYQGEKYNLDNNECVPICDQPYSDETGSLRWNNTTKKCERTCNPGYVSW